MSWNQAQGNWFSLGQQMLPQLDTWKTLSAVKGAHRSGAILKVDDAVEAAQRASQSPQMTTKYVGTNDLFVASETMLQGLGAFDLQAKQRRSAVEELRNRARAARDYYAAGAPVIQAILSRPTDIYRLLDERASVQVVVDRVFRNFVAYARTHWSYSAMSNYSGEDLLAGRTTTIPCGGIANALKIVLQGVLKDPGQVRFHTLSSYLLTKTRYVCFDPRVRGNAHDKAGSFDGSCLFKEHYFLSWGGLYFDACMTGVYITDTDVIDFRPEVVRGSNTVKALARPGATKAEPLFLLDRATAAPGFNATWLRITIRDATTVDALRSAVTPSVAEALRGNPAEAQAIAEFCARAG